MAHAIVPSALRSPEPIAAETPQRKPEGFARSVLALLAAVHAGLVASHRYETLRARGASHPEAIDRAFAELGFGT